MVLDAAAVLDIEYQLIDLHTVYVGEAITVAVLLALVPYFLLRTPVTRLAGKKKSS
jgi:predicted LPLAT superfamily acyltransferase